MSEHDNMRTMSVESAALAAFESRKSNGLLMSISGTITLFNVKGSRTEVTAKVDQRPFGSYKSPISAGLLAEI